MERFCGYLRLVWLPQRNLGTFAWLAHRLTGVALAAYLVPHLVTIHRAREGAAALDRALAWYTGPLVAAGEFVLVGVVVFHLFNGLRVIAVDFFDLSHRQKALFWVVLAACGAVMVAASWLFVPRILAPA